MAGRLVGLGLSDKDKVLSGAAALDNSSRIFIRGMAMFWKGIVLAAESPSYFFRP
jgi:hypothetical protein